MSHINRVVLLAGNDMSEEHAYTYTGSTLRTDAVCFSSTLSIFKTAKCHNLEVTAVETSKAYKL
jgi:hypothetical protein